MYIVTMSIDEHNECLPSSFATLEAAQAAVADWLLITSDDEFAADGLRWRADDDCPRLIIGSHDDDDYLVADFYVWRID